MTRATAAVCVSAVAAVFLAVSPAAAQENTWFESMVGQPAQAVATEVRQPVRKKLVAVTRRPAAEASSEKPVSEPRTSSLSGGITWQASSSCVPATLRGVLADLVGNFGPVIVTSTCRGRAQNRAAGGAGHSYHLSGEAVDFRVSGSASAVQAFLSSSNNVGGHKHYGGGLYHIDTGPRRSW
jgi:Peptidase M15